MYLSLNDIAFSRSDDWISSNFSFTYATNVDGSIDIPNTFPAFPGMSLLETTTQLLDTSRGPISILIGTPCKTKLLKRMRTIRADCYLSHKRVTNLHFPEIELPPCSSFGCVIKFNSDPSSLKNFLHWWCSTENLCFLSVFFPNRYDHYLPRKNREDNVGGIIMRFRHKENEST